MGTTKEDEAGKGLLSRGSRELIANGAAFRVPVLFYRAAGEANLVS